MENQHLKWLFATLIVGGVLWLTYLAINRGPSELTALAAVLSATSVLLANIAARGK